MSLCRLAVAGLCHQPAEDGDALHALRDRFAIGIPHRHHLARTAMLRALGDGGEQPPAIGRLRGRGQQVDDPGQRADRHRLLAEQAECRRRQRVADRQQRVALHVAVGLLGVLAHDDLALEDARALAADEVTIRWWSPQASPEQLAMYQAQIATFEAANPGVKVLFEPTSDEGYPAQLAAAFAAKQVPNVLTHLPSFAAQNYYGQGLLEPMDDVIKAIGESNYFPGANDVYKTADGHYCGTPIGNTAADMLWLRKDLMAKAGIDKAPETWDELRTAAQKMQGG
eukprot:gene40877-55241_t